MSATATDVSLGMGVPYTDTRDHLKAALVIGTFESTGGSIPEGQVALRVFNPLTGKGYYRTASWDEEKETFVNSHSG